MKVDVLFDVRSHCVHEQYSYPLYAAVKQVIGAVALEARVQVAPLEGGRRIQPDIYYRPTTLRLRCAEAAVLDVAPLAGQELRVGEHVITLGALRVEPLRPSRSLEAAWVRIGDGPDSQRAPLPHGEFAGRLARLLERAGVRLGARRVKLGGKQSKHLGSKGRWLWGYGARVDDLTEHESVALQSAQIGGGRCLGGGVFLPRRRGRRCAST